MMSKITVCDICKKPIEGGLYDEDYVVVVKKRWWSYDGFQPYREKTKLNIDSKCMKKLIGLRHKY